MKTSKQLRAKEIINLSISMMSQKKPSRSIVQFSQNTQEFLLSMEKLLIKLQANKVRKITQQLKNKNVFLKQYLNQNRIQTLKFQDIIKFQELHEKYQNDYSKKNPCNNIEKIKLGFLELKVKMQKIVVDDLQTQIRYCSSTIDRQIAKLQKQGIEYEGAFFVKNSYSLATQIEEDQKQNGRYLLLNQNQIRKSIILEDAWFKFKTVFSQK